MLHPLFPGFAPSLELTIHVCRPSRRRRRVSVFKRRRRRVTLSRFGPREGGEPQFSGLCGPIPFLPSASITHVEFVPIPRVLRTLARIELCQVAMLHRAAPAAAVALSVIPILRRPIKNRKCVSHYVTYRRRSTAVFFPSFPSLGISCVTPFHIILCRRLLYSFPHHPQLSLESPFDRHPPNGGTHCCKVP